MASASVENYLKAIYHLQREHDRVKTKAIADALDLALPSVTSMLKTLARQSLLDYIPYQGVRLTEDGRRAALKVIRKHRLIELFLVETLGLDWSQVHTEAELLEHAMSEFLTERIDAYLGFPTLDPHGDPIPTREGVMPTQTGVLLDALPLGVRSPIQRVLTQDSERLSYLHTKGLTLGVEICVTEQAPFGGPITLALLPNGATVSLSRAFARLIVVAPPTAEAHAAPA